MKKSVFIILTLAVGLCVVGCGKKQKSLEEMQEPMSMEALSSLKAENKTATEAKTPEQVTQGQAPSVPVSQLEPLPPSGPYKPTVMDIQTALKNAGYYAGNVDGKLGPKTKAAIEEFQKASGLTVDGKVGPKTWNLLRQHLSSASAGTPTGQ
ncbi:MAG: peptidoglycan-binding domain-containing protein [Deltaproteobacteria bacterium]